MSQELMRGRKRESSFIGLTWSVWLLFAHSVLEKDLRVNWCFQMNWKYIQMVQVKDVQEKSSPKGRTGIEQKGEKAARGKQEGRDAQLQPSSSGACRRAGAAQPELALESQQLQSHLPLPRARRKPDVHAFCWQENGSFLQKPSFTLVNLCSGLTLPNWKDFPLATIYSESWGNSIWWLSLSISCLQHVTMIWTRRLGLCSRALL